MNQKRWVAIAIAAVILILSAITPQYQIDTKQENVQLNKLSKYLLDEETITEKVIEQGSSSDKILKLALNGAIISSTPSIMNSNAYDHDFLLKQLENALEDVSIKGILFTVNTPGGGVYESAEIRNAILKIKEQRSIPIYVSMLSMAASGGYYVSADATKIYATEETWTGSIGVIIQSLNLKGLLEKHGIYSQIYKSGKLKDMGSPYSETSVAEKAVFQSLIDESYDKFVKIIAEGRNMNETEVRKIADGRIYTAKQALDINLVDAIGYPEDALSALKKENGLENCTVFEYEKNTSREFFKLFTQAHSMLNKNTELNQIKKIFESHYNSAPMPYYIYGGQ